MGSLLPVQAAYYVTMMASMPARMLMSMANSMGASQAMQAGKQTLLNSVSQILDGKMKLLMSGIRAEMRGFAQRSVPRWPRQVGWVGCRSRMVGQRRRRRWPFAPPRSCPTPLSARW